MTVSVVLARSAELLVRDCKEAHVQRKPSRD